MKKDRDWDSPLQEIASAVAREQLADYKPFMRRQTTASITVRVGQIRVNSERGA
jgi:hypothetical protein